MTHQEASHFILAERQGFEPWVTLLPHTRSRRANSTTLAPLRSLDYYTAFLIIKNMVAFVLKTRL